ncbi:TetR family transcriptional regulator [Herbihabitans rhizosphaerae]|uniref:TetR family transcriptional regulator n=1 Tax=Herbihabitans rhizosphaerae TaxID=1872711 RepID=A0A4Q7L622_9PSEU|nr:TetR/AcrR family transcriptional regulator [Herbihabitans rhizosphaerae]RZS44696.1 TetR family transcriptional regulator [Herbihabitans rhizosphaerae]
MAEDSELDLPASIAASWGLRERSGKGPKPGLSIDRIVRAAVAIAESDGLGAVSMSRVAADLGASTMSLYRYVASKDELLMLMMDAPVAKPPESRPDEGWRAGLERWARELRVVYLRHPWLVRVPISGPPITPNQIMWMEAALRALTGTPLEEGEKVSTVLLLSALVRSDVALFADLQDAARTGPYLQHLLRSYSRWLRTLTDEERFPAVRAAVDAGVFDEAENGVFVEPEEDYDFEFGLGRVLDGLDALMRSRSG